MGYNLLINGEYWGYNPLTNHLLTSWDIQVVWGLHKENQLLLGIQAHLLRMVSWNVKTMRFGGPAIRISWWEKEPCLAIQLSNVAFKPWVERSSEHSCCIMQISLIQRAPSDASMALGSHDAVCSEYDGSTTSNLPMSSARRSSILASAQDWTSHYHLRIWLDSIVPCTIGIKYGP